MLRAKVGFVNEGNFCILGLVSSSKRVERGLKRTCSRVRSDVEALVKFSEEIAMMVLPVRVRVVGAKLAMGAAIALALVGTAPGAKAEDVTKAYTVSGRPNVRVDTNDGSVTVSSGDTKEVRFRVEYQGYELNKNLRVDSRQDGDRVELIARVTGNWGFNWGMHGKRLHIEVVMPRTGDLQVSTGDGAVEASSLDGNIVISTGDGSVKAHGLNGTIDLHTGDGSINVEGLKGDIKMRTGDGSVEARGLDGKVNADSGDGHIKLEGRFDSLTIRTGDGSVEAHANGGSRMNSAWNIHTGDGSVDMTLPGDLQANIDASTGDGHISLGMPVTVEGSFSNSQIHGKMNGGGSRW